MNFSPGIIQQQKQVPNGNIGFEYFIFNALIKVYERNDQKSLCFKELRDYIINVLRRIDLYSQLKTTSLRINFDPNEILRIHMNYKEYLTIEYINKDIKFILKEPINIFELKDKFRYRMNTTLLEVMLTDSMFFRSKIKLNKKGYVH